MLAAVFVAGGIDVLRDPHPRVAKAESIAPQLAAKVGLPQDTELLVKINAFTHVVAGILLALGKLRRLSALVLLGSLVPTTYAGHRFWELDDPKEQGNQRFHFLKNLAIAGGLLLEIVDTEGRPSVGWRSQQAVNRAVHGAAATGLVATSTARAVRGSATQRATELGRDLAGTAVKAKALKDVASRTSGVAETALKEGALRATALKDVAGKALDGGTPKDLVEKARAKGAPAIAQLAAHAGLGGR